MTTKTKKNNLGIVGKITEFFLKNRELSILVILALFFWGILSFLIIPKQYNPQIVAPAFNIITEFPGAGSEEVYELITRPMELKLKEVPGVDKIMSQSKEGGVSVVTVLFEIGEDLEKSKISLMQKIEGNLDLKPLGVQEPLIKTIDPDNVPIITIGFSSEKLSEESLRKMAYDVGDRLKHVQGVSEVNLKGGRRKVLRADLDLDKLNGYSISPLQIVNKIKQNNFSSKVGEIETSKNNYRLKIKGNIEGVHDLSNLVILNNNNGEIYLKDLSRVTYSHEKIENYVNLNSKKGNDPAVYLTIAKTKGSNITKVARDVLDEFEEVKKDPLLNNVKATVVRDDGKVASEAVNTLTKNLFISISIVSFVLFLFLGWRSALIVSIAIPLTLATVFGIGLLAGQTINRITLFALILSLGLLVDSATVVVENIYRFLKKNTNLKNKNKIDLIARAVDEVGGGLIMSTITTILAFYPMAFVTGMMGPYMGPIPFFVPSALIASLLIAITVNPYLAYVFFNRQKSKKIEKEKEGNVFLKIIDKIKKSYHDFLKFLLENRKKNNLVLVFVLILFVLSLSLPVLKIVKFRMLPKADREQFYVYLDLPKGTNLNETKIKADQVSDYFLSNEEVLNVQNFVGIPPVVDFNGLFKGSEGRNSSSQATLKINLTHPNKRKETSEELVLRMRKDLSNKDFILNNPDLRIKFIEDPPGPPVLSTFLVKVQGEDQTKIEEIAKDLENKVMAIKGVVDVDNSINEDKLEFVYKIQKEKASRLGVNVNDIVQTLNVLLNGSKVGLFHEKNSENLRKVEEEYIFLRLNKNDRNEFNDFSKINILNNQGEQILLSELVEKSHDDTNSLILSDEKRKTIYVTGEMGKRSVTYASIDMLLGLLEYKLPNGEGEIKKINLSKVVLKDRLTGEEFLISIDGEWKLTLDVFRDLGLAMAVAVFLIYFVLVAQFRSLIEPLIIMGTIPLTLIGVLPGFAILGLVKGVYFNATSMIGVIALSGIVVNNAIILLEYLKDLNKKNYEIKEALLKAGKTRMLPILLTSLTTILASLTIISDPVWEGLAWSIIWGLSLSAFLTLIIFPILYFKIFEKKWGNNNKLK
ncbi:MAG: MMPL family transporter [Candidatus Moranbacteria bacterium]|nr:MMPL family transporter [Candidatus Moranbacteria bacterium]